MKYRRYDDTFKVEAVELALQPGVQTQEVATSLVPDDSVSPRRHALWVAREVLEC